jgi:hypothetical protein
MSALPPKADMCGAKRDFRYVPIGFGGTHILDWTKGQRSNPQKIGKV